MKKVSVVLASASPRRSEILSDLKLRFEVVPSDVDEIFLEKESAVAGAKRLAMIKAELASRSRPDALVIAADTVVVLDGEIMGKPVDEADARRMLTLLSGREHEVVTGLAFMLGGEDIFEAMSSTTRVVFKGLSQKDIDEYIATGEYKGKAGGYAIQGKGGGLISECKGSFSNVVGLPVTEILKFAFTFGYDRLPWE